MAIHPIDYRYGTPEMRAIWDEENRFLCIVRAEVALAQAEAEHGLIPANAAAAIERCAGNATLERSKAIEEKIQHDMMAVVRTIAEVCNEAGNYVHYGATSNDILDTATALQLSGALALIETKLCRLLGVLRERSIDTRAL
ncbi:MAG: adenylosuccinate lyase, partial [Methanomicrobiales archaeon]|nr:adenylosuccinate lyase [Methanomicrobiales archaeon]